MDLADVLMNCYKTSKLEKLAVQWELSRKGGKEKLARRISRSAIRWIRYQDIENYMYWLHYHADPKRTSRFFPTAANERNGIDRNQFYRFLGSTKELAPRISVAEKSISTIEFLECCLGNLEDYRRLARRMELHDKGNREDLGNRIFEGLVEWSSEEETRDVFAHLFNESDVRLLRECCRDYELNDKGTRRELFLRLAACVFDLPPLIDLEKIQEIASNNGRVYLSKGRKNKQRRLNILFVCSANTDRSKTAEIIYRDHPQLEVRSAGTDLIAAHRVDRSDLEWADLVLVMEEKHKAYIRISHADWWSQRFFDVKVLEIPNAYHLGDDDLTRAIKQRAGEILKGRGIGDLPAA